MSIINNVLRILEEKKLTQSALCAHLGINTSTMTNWKVRDTDPPAKMIVPICEFIGVDPFFLLTGKAMPVNLSDDEAKLLEYYSVLGQMEKGMVIGRAELLAEQAECRSEPSHNPVITQSQTQSEEQESEDYISIPYFDLPVSAGRGAELHDQSGEDPIRVPDTPTTRMADYALRISGNSMEPKFHDGDIVLITAQDCVDDGEIGIFIIDGKGYIKQQQPGLLVSLNPAYDDIKIHDYDSVFCKGLVVGTL